MTSFWLKGRNDADTSWILATLLKLDPRRDPLRTNPKFEPLLANYEVKP